MKAYEEEVDIRRPARPAAVAVAAEAVAKAALAVAAAAGGGGGGSSSGSQHCQPPSSMPADQSGGGDDLDVLSSTDWPAVHISTNRNNHARPWYRVFVNGGQELRRRGESANAHLLHNNQLG